MDRLSKSREPGIDLNVEIMGRNEGEHLPDVNEATKSGRGNGLLPKVHSPAKSLSNASGTPRTELEILAQKLLTQCVSKSRPDQWGLLTALTEKARKRRSHGCGDIALHRPVHVFGRMVEDVNFMFESGAVSGRHCSVSRKLVSSDGRIKSPGTDRVLGDMLVTFVKDHSSNGTFINKQKLEKGGPEVRLCHGDVISLVAFHENENAFAFLFREFVEDSSCKRKGSPSEKEAEIPFTGDMKRIRSTGDGGPTSVVPGFLDDFRLLQRPNEEPRQQLISKRIRGTGEGVSSSDGPVSLDDVRLLQKSNEELRQQLEVNVLYQEKMRGEFRSAEALHLGKLEEVRASVTDMFAKQNEKIRLELESKSRELEKCIALRSQQETVVEDLNHRLASAAKSKADAEEAIRSQATSIAELKKRLDEEFSQHQKERAEWEAKLEAAVEKARKEASEEIRRHSDAFARLQKQQEDIIADLQEADKENRRLADSLRIKLEAERQTVIKVEENGRRLEMQVQEERLSKEKAFKTVADLQEELTQVRKELESEKEARESAGAKVASLELAMETAIRNLALEKRRSQGERERVVLRETQLRQFYSIAAQVEALQQKQQRQLNAMLKTLEDGDGEGEYAERKNGKSPDGEPVGDEPKIGALTVNVDGEEKKQFLAGEPSVPKAGNAEPDWMDGDTQREDEDCFVAPKSPSAADTQIKEGDVNMGNQDEVGEDDDSGPKAVNGKTEGETQVLPEHGITTQLVADSLQNNDFSGGPAFGKESLDFRLWFRNERRKSNLGVNASGSGSQNVGVLLRGHRIATEGFLAEGETQETYNDPREILPRESVGTGTAAENDTMPPDDPPVLKMGSTMSSAYEESQIGRRNERAGTMCTDDLLTSEIAGSWAMGTQASVHTGTEARSHRIPGARRSEALANETQLLTRDQEGTMCTDDLLASEVAGSWAAGTPASVHADNESIGSEERDQPDPDEGGSQAAALSRPRANPHQLLLDEAMLFADPVNSQNSLSPATTNPARNDIDALNQMLEIVEPGFSSEHGLSKLTRRHHHSDTDDSTTDGEDENVRSDSSQRFNQSPPVSVK